MSKITDFIIDRKELVIIGTIIAVLIASVGLQTLEFSSGASDEALPSDLKSVENQEILQNNFGSDDTIMVSVAVDDYSEINSILDPEVVESTYKFTENVKDRDFVNQASSYASLIYKVLGRAPKSKEEVKNVINRYPQLKNSISEDQTTTVINVGVNAGSGLIELGKVLNKVDQSITNSGFPKGVKVTQTGSTSIAYNVIKMLQSDLTKLLLIALVLVFGSLVIFYRGIVRAFIPIIPLIIGVILTVGILSLIGKNINPATVSIGAMLIGMGIDYGVHVYNRYYEERSKGRDPDKSAKISINGVGKAIVGTSATTMAGFASLYLSRISFMKDLSIALVLGISLSMIFALIFLPVLITYEERIRKRLVGHYDTVSLAIHTGTINKLFIRLTNIVNNNYKKIIAFFFFVTLFMSYGATKTKMETSMEEVLPEDMDEINALEEIRNKLGGEDTVSVIIKAQDGRDIRNPELLRKTKSMQKFMVKDSYNTKISSYSSITSIFNDEIPNTEKQIKTAFKRNPTTSEYVSRDYSILRVTLEGGIEEDKQSETQKNLENIESNLDQINFPSGYEASLGGSLVLNEAMRTIAQQDLSKISIFGFIGILIVVLILFRSVTDGIIMATPMALGAIWTFGFVGFTGMQINQFLIGFLSMILGLGIDFGMHITHRYREAKEIKETLTSVGPGILAASLTTILGYLALLSGSLPMIRTLGTILAVGISASMFTSFLLAPSLIKLKEEYKGGKKDETKKSKK